MVSSSQTYLVDTTFILEKAADAFHGAPLLVVDGKDHTFAYGFLRELLLARRALGIKRGILVVGAEGHAAASDVNVTAVVGFTKVLGLPVVHKSERTVLDICYELSDLATHLITNDTKQLQLTTEHLNTIRPAARNEYECLTPACVSSRVGVKPLHVPTFLALHNSENGRKTSGPLTKRQTIRLIELYGDLESIYTNLAEIKAAAIRDKLASGRDAIMRTYSSSKVDATSPVDIAIDGMRLSWRVDNKRTAEVLHAHRFHSLVRLLSQPDVCAPNPARVRKANHYRTVQTKEDIQELEAAVSGSDVCALDTESDDKDPRKANLLGVAFSVRKETAMFVPLLERDLKGISRDEVLAALQRMLSKQRRIVGHNLKYDALLLRRHGVTIRNIYFDTMLAAYDCFGDWDFFNLGFLVEKLLGKRIKRYNEIVRSDQTFLDLPLKEMTDHGCQDADFALRLYEKLDEELALKNLSEQFADTTMKLVRKLADYEFNGVSVSQKKLEQTRNSLLAEIDSAKACVWETLGQKFDLDATKELTAALKAHLDIRGSAPAKLQSLRRLEELAIPHRDILSVVTYKRLRKQLKHVESISAAAKGNKIHPLFNQIRSLSGRLHSSAPSLFDDYGLQTVWACINSTGLRHFFPIEREAVDCIATESKDPQLMMDRGGQCSGNTFMAQHTTLKALNHDDFLLAVVCGESGPALSRRFTIERMQVESACHDLQVRYGRMFEWLSQFREGASRNGHVTGPKGLKYVSGIRSSSIEKRKKAIDACVRWRIGW